MKKYMEEALKEAKKAAAMGEIPIGAVIVTPDFFEACSALRTASSSQ